MKFCGVQLYKLNDSITESLCDHCDSPTLHIMGVFLSTTKCQGTCSLGSEGCCAGADVLGDVHVKHSVLPECSQFEG